MSKAKAKAKPRAKPITVSRAILAKIIKQQDDFNARLTKIEESIGSGGKPIKKKKDPNAPKRCRNAFIFYCNDFRDQVRGENPEENSSKVIMTILGDRWRNLKEAKKKPYLLKAENDKKRYAREIKEYEAKQQAGDEESEEDQF